MRRQRLDAVCETGVTGLVVAILVFGPLATGAVRPLEFLILQGLTILALLLWLFRIWLNSGLRLLWPPVCWAVTGFVGYAAGCYSFADIEYAARQELIRILIYAILFFLVLNNIYRQESIHFVSWILVFLGMGVSIYAIYQFATGSNQVWHFLRPANYAGRGSGTYVCPNHLAGFLEMIVPLGLSYGLIGRIPHLLRVFVVYASLVIVSGICITFSRGGWLAAGLSLVTLLLCLIRKRDYRLPAFLLLGLLVAGVAAFYTRADRAQKRVDKMLSGDSPETAQSRIWLWKPALAMWRDNFWWGAGPAHFDHRFPAYRPAEIQARPGYAHNDYLNLLTDYGIVGTGMTFAALLLLCAGILKSWKSVHREQRDLAPPRSNRSAFILGGSTGLLAVFIHSFFDFNMHIPANAILAVTLMALLSAHLRFTSERYWVTPGLLGRVCTTVVALSVVGYLVHQAWRRAQEHIWLERATREKYHTPARMGALQRAAAIEPTNFETTYKVGEALRQQGWRGHPGYEKLLTKAIEWFERGTRLNPYDPYNYMRIGMCLDQLGRPVEATPYFEEAVRRDPNNYYVLAHQGWHFMRVGDYLEARKWFERSVELQHAWKNPIASSYLGIIDRKLKESASQDRSAPMP